jgi:hypothetical protein
LPPQSVQAQAGWAVAVKAKAVTASKAKMNFFIFESPLKFRSSFLPSTWTEADAG